jgi:hypothetical protein
MSKARKRGLHKKSVSEKSVSVHFSLGAILLRRRPVAGSCVEGATLGDLRRLLQILSRLLSGLVLLLIRKTAHCPASELSGSFIKGDGVPAGNAKPNHGSKIDTPAPVNW